MIIIVVTVSQMLNLNVFFQIRLMNCYLFFKQNNIYKLKCAEDEK